MYVVYFIEFHIKAKFLDNTSVYIVKLPFIFKIPGQRLSKNHNIQTDSKNVTIIKNSDSNNEIIIQIFTIFTKKSLGQIIQSAMIKQIKQLRKWLILTS